MKFYLAAAVAVVGVVALGHAEEIDGRELEGGGSKTCDTFYRRACYRKCKPTGGKKHGDGCGAVDRATCLSGCALKFEACAGSNSKCGKKATWFANNCNIQEIANRQAETADEKREEIMEEHEEAQEACMENDDGWKAVCKKKKARRKFAKEACSTRSCVRKAQRNAKGCRKRWCEYTTRPECINGGGGHKK